MSIAWTNRSVLEFARTQNPIVAMEQAARKASLAAIDNGWSGPPFDPLKLAEALGHVVEARSDIPDARTVPLADGRLKIEFNPLRPRARVRFSIAHEVAHSLFPDCSARVRNRGGTHATHAGTDDWQLEVLCNLGAAELLMPLGSFPSLQDSEISIDRALELRKEFDVSIEALLIRLMKLTGTPSAAFCASRSAEAKRYRIDYFIPSSGWQARIKYGTLVPEISVINEANAIGYTAKGVETWIAETPMRVECVGLAPYPGSTIPRVVGLAVPTADVEVRTPQVIEVVGNALEPRGTGQKIIAHVVPDASTVWGGGGFAAALKKKYPDAWKDFRLQAHGSKSGIALGRSYKGRVSDDTSVFHMVAQHGIGPSTTPRIRYSALEDCLEQLKQCALELRASVHMPRIGTGHAAGDWNLIREMIATTVADDRIPTTIYSLPNR